MQISSRRCFRVLLLAACVLGPAASAEASLPAITAVPALQPAFDPAIGDYVTRCAGAPVRLSVDAAADTTVAVDGDGARSGTFERGVALDVNRAFSIAVAGQTTRTYHVRCLPADFPPYTAQRSATPQASHYLVTPGLALGPFPAGFSQGYAVFYDSGGAPAWWYQVVGDVPIDAKLLPNGHVAWSLAGGHGGMEERTLDGTLARTLNTVGNASDIHELQQLPDGNYLMPIYRPLEHVDLTAVGGPADATILDAVVQELTPAGGLVWEWRASDHIPATELPASWRGPIVTAGSSPYDIYHLNSIERDGDGLVISFRVLDAVYKVAGAGSGDVDWKLGGVDVPGESLAVVGDPVLAGPSPDPNGPLSGQHDARILPDGDLTVHDNGTHLVGGAWSGRPPRAVRFAIDETARTATFVEQVTDPAEQQSVCCGGARRLPGGNWVMSWGGTGRVTELTATGTSVFSLDFAAPIFSYRANPILADQLSADQLRAGMDARFGRSSLAIGGASPNLGSQAVSTVGSRRTFTITNSGNAPATITGVALTGDDGAQFDLAGGGCRGATLAIGASCEAKVRFAPEEIGAKTATLRVDSDAASSPNEAVLTATGESATPVVAPPPPPIAATPAGDTAGTVPARLAPRSLAVASGCRRVTGTRVRCTISGGTLRPAAGLAALDRRTVCSGSVRVRFLAAGRVIATRRLALSTACRYRGSATFSLATSLARRLGAQARYGGNAVSLPKRSRVVRVAVR